MTPSTNRKTTRRQYVVGFGATVLIAGSATSSTAFADEDNGVSTKDDDGSSRDPHRRLNHVLAVDTDLNLRFDNRMHLAGDAANDGRDSAVHVTSREEPTRDYILSLVDARDQDLRLEDVRSSGALLYDYYEGPTSEAAVPGEVFLILRGDDGEFLVAMRREDDPDAAGAWQTRDVSAELRRGGWRTVDVPADEVDTHREAARVTSDTIIGRARALADGDPVSNLVERAGSDSQLLGLGIGAGGIANPASTDAYYDDVQVGRVTNSVPAMLTMDLAFVADENTLTATLTPAPSDRPNAAISLEENALEWVRISPYAPVTIPVAGTEAANASIPAHEVALGDDALEVQFDVEAVSEMVSRGVTDTVMVYGALDSERPITFLAVGDSP